MEPIDAMITKIDDDKRLVFGWASIIKDVEGRVLLDRQDDYIDSEEELEKAAYTYVLNSRDGGEMHVRRGVSTMVESVVLSKEKQSALGIPEGTVPVGWWIGFRVNDDRVWDQVKKGDYVGFSVHGTGHRGQGVLKDGEYTEVEKGDDMTVCKMCGEEVRKGEVCKCGYEVGKGDFPGHPFRGNQWVKVSSSGGGSAGKGKGEGKAKSLKNKTKALLEGKEVKADTVEEASLLIEELKKEIDRIKESTGKPPNINLCKVTVPGTNLFCGGNKGIPRAEMPQFSGRPEEGTPASKREPNKKGEVDGTKDFEKHLVDELGVGVERKKVKAANLKATQTELVGDKVIGMINNKDFDPAGEAIFVSSDGYVIDGHHRWAAQIGRDTSDGKLGDLQLNVIMVDMPISKIIPLANEWAKEFGIAPKAAKVDDLKKGDCGCGGDSVTEDSDTVTVSKRLLEVLTKAQQSKTEKRKAQKIKRVMGEYKRGELESSSGDKVNDRKQAMAIALSEARRMKKGDKPGHPFRGNQWTGGIPGTGNSGGARKRRPKADPTSTDAVQDTWDDVPQASAKKLAPNETREMMWYGMKDANRRGPVTGVKTVKVRDRLVVNERSSYGGSPVEAKVLKVYPDGSILADIGPRLTGPVAADDIVGVVGTLKA